MIYFIGIAIVYYIIGICVAPYISVNETMLEVQNKIKNNGSLLNTDICNIGIVALWWPFSLLYFLIRYTGLGIGWLISYIHDRSE